MYITPVGAQLSNTGKIHERYLSQSIRRLSTGSSVNSASDGGASLKRKTELEKDSVSLGTFSQGLSDKISLHEEADSGLKEISSLLSSMRSLAVEASSGSVSQADRATLNEELSLLKNEISAVLASTEYNTKRLLNGSLAGSITTSRPDLVTPHPTGELKNSTYNLQLRYDPKNGDSNQVLSTNIFSVKEGLAAISDSDMKGTKATLNIAANFSATGSLSFNFDGDTYTLALAAQADTNTIVSALNSDAWVSSYLLATYNASGTVTLQARTQGSDKNSWTVTRDYSGIATAALSFSGGTDSINGITTVSNPVSILTSPDATSIYTVGLQFTSATTESASITAILARYEQTGSTASALQLFSGAVTAPSGGGYLAVEFLASASLTTAAGSVDISYSFDGSTWNSLTLGTAYFQNSGVTLTDGSASVTIGNTGITTMAVNAGDKHLFSLPDTNYNPSGNHYELRFTAPVENGLGGSTQNSTTYSRTSDELDSATTTFSLLQLDTANGAWAAGSIDLTLSAIVTSSLLTHTISFGVDGSGGIANHETPLSSVGTFFSDDGVFLLSDSGNTLEIKNKRGDSATVALYPSDTIGELTTKLRDAVATLFDTSGLGEAALRNLVTYSTVSASGSLESSAGKFYLRSPLPGSEGELFIAAENDEIADAFSFTEAQEAQGSPFTVSKNGTTARLTGGSYYGIDGARLDITPETLLTTGWSGRSGNLVFSAKNTAEIAVSVTDTAPRYLRSSNGGTDSFAIPDFSEKALKLQRIDISTLALSERAVTLIDEASSKMNRYLGRLGGRITADYSRQAITDATRANYETASTRLFGTDTPREYAEMTKRLMLTSLSGTLFNSAKSYDEAVVRLLS